LKSTGIFKENENYTFQTLSIDQSNKQTEKGKIVTCFSCSSIWRSTPLKSCSNAERYDNMQRVNHLKLIEETQKNQSNRTKIELINMI